MGELVTAIISIGVSLVGISSLAVRTELFRSSGIRDSGTDSGPVIMTAEESPTLGDHLACFKQQIKGFVSSRLSLSDRHRRIGDVQ